MDSMAAHYNNEINKVRATMRRNRSHASRMLARKTSQLYSAIAKSQRAQLAVNKKLAAQTRRARLDIKDSLRNAKRDFGRRMAKLHSTIVRNDRKFDGKMKKLTGVVNANAVKSRRGRAMLAAMMKANRAELLGAVSGAVRKGESRMMGVENSLKSLSAKTKASLNMRITSEISKLSKNIGKSVENLRLSSKSARAEMRKEMLYAVRSAAAQAKNNLAASVRTAKAVFGKVARNEAAAARRSAAAAIRGANAASAARQVTVLTTLKSAMSKAQRRANRKFGKAYRKLAKDRAHADTALAGAVNRMNDGLAKQAALADARFSHTVKNIAAARAQARNQVAAARRSFTTAMVRVTSEVKDQETRLSGEIAVVSGEVVSNRAAQMRVNRRTSAELKRVTKIANDRRP